MVKVTSGKYRGQNLDTPGEKTHPMGAREKLALFNIVSEYLSGNRVIDVFAGSGALGIEALSRGASFVLFIEKDAKACKVIKANLEKLGITSEQGKVLQGDAYTLVQNMNEKFDVVLVDPPYDRYDGSSIQVFVEVVVDGGVLVLSHPGEAPELPNLELITSRKYAGATISVYAKR